MKEYHLVESRLISTHFFEGDFYCTHCGKPRCLHSITDFMPSTSPSHLPTDPKASYRGHVYWARPGGLSQQEKGELFKEQLAERARIEAAIARDKESYRVKTTTPSSNPS